MLDSRPHSGRARSGFWGFGRSTHTHVHTKYDEDYDDVFE